MKNNQLTAAKVDDPTLTNKEPLLVIKSLSAGYGKSLVITDVSLHVAPGEIVAMIGPNGAGKSTVLRSVFSITTLKGGEILVGNEVITKLSAVDLVRKHIIYVNQGKVVFQNLTVKENLEMAGSLIYKKKELAAKIEYVLSIFPALKEKLRSRTFALSGGQQQQVALARGLVQDAKLLLLDEPTLGLSPVLQQDLFEKLIMLSEKNVAILMVEQNVRSAIKHAHRTYLLENGKIVLTGGKEIIDNDLIKKVYLGG
ncbi:high-affinity branched-chain amino acid transport ATP-binding protein LivF [Spirochaetota bacterium]|nr:high-affinity branched-chain amino acid transport ATP-binding protein LivF [Spirochaetota bacterium]